MDVVMSDKCRSKENIEQRFIMTQRISYYMSHKALHLKNKKCIDTSPLGPYLPSFLTARLEMSYATQQGNYVTRMRKSWSLTVIIILNNFGNMFILVWDLNQSVDILKKSGDSIAFTYKDKSKLFNNFLLVYLPTKTPVPCHPFL